LYKDAIYDMVVYLYDYDQILTNRFFAYLFDIQHTWLRLFLFLMTLKILSNCAQIAPKTVIMWLDRNSFSSLPFTHPRIHLMTLVLRI